MYSCRARYPVQERIAPVQPLMMDIISAKTASADKLRSTDCPLTPSLAPAPLPAPLCWWPSMSGQMRKVKTATSTSMQPFSS
eukprot:33764_4